MKNLIITTVLLALSLGANADVIVSKKGEPHKKTTFSCNNEDCSELLMTQYWEDGSRSRVISKMSALMEKKNIPTQYLSYIDLPYRVDMLGMEAPFLTAGVYASAYLTLFPVGYCIMYGDPLMCALGVPGIAGTLLTLPLGLAIDVVKAITVAPAVGIARGVDKAVNRRRWNRAFNQIRKMTPDSKDKRIILRGLMFDRFNWIYMRD